MKRNNIYKMRITEGGKERKCNGWRLSKPGEKKKEAHKIPKRVSPRHIIIK